MDRRGLGQAQEMEASIAALPDAPESTNEQAPTADALPFRSLFDEHHAFVWRSLLHLGVGSAWVDDAVQEVFLIVHRRLEQYDRRLPLRAWLWGIARNVALNQKRSRMREARRRDALATERSDAPDVAVDRARDLRYVREILLSLDEILRDVLVLSDVEGMTAPEIASALEVNVNTIYSRLRIGRQRFAELARKRGYAPGGTDGR